MNDPQVRLRCPECRAAYAVPAAQAPDGQPCTLHCPDCLLGRGKVVPLVRAEQAPEEGTP
jgi:hypothetical protein